jgi:hypothetical protein
LLLEVVKFMYVLSEYQKQHNALYVLKGDGCQCFQPFRKWSKLRYMKTCKSRNMWSVKNE